MRSNEGATNNPRQSSVNSALLVLGLQTTRRPFVLYCNFLLIEDDSLPLAGREKDNEKMTPPGRTLPALGAFPFQLHSASSRERIRLPFRCHYSGPHDTAVALATGAVESGSIIHAWGQCHLTAANNPRARQHNLHRERPHIRVCCGQHFVATASWSSARYAEHCRGPRETKARAAGW